MIGPGCLYCSLECRLRHASRHKATPKDPSALLCECPCRSRACHSTIARGDSSHKILSSSSFQELHEFPSQCLLALCSKPHPALAVTVLGCTCLRLRSQDVEPNIPSVSLGLGHFFSFILPSLSWTASRLVRCTRKAKDVDPDNPSVWLGLGHALFDLKNFPAAAAAFSKAAALAPVSERGCSRPRPGNSSFAAPG